MVLCVCVWCSENIPGGGHCRQPNRKECLGKRFSILLQFCCSILMSICVQEEEEESKKNRSTNSPTKPLLPGFQPLTPPSKTPYHVADNTPPGVLHSGIKETIRVDGADGTSRRWRHTPLWVHLLKGLRRSLSLSNATIDGTHHQSYGLGACGEQTIFAMRVQVYYD
jgi:hypothetical protein